jgi:hypothetical protein
MYIELAGKSFFMIEAGGLSLAGNYNLTAL